MSWKYMNKNNDKCYRAQGQSLCTMDLNNNNIYSFFLLWLQDIDLENRPMNRTLSDYIERLSDTEII